MGRNSREWYDVVTPILEGILECVLKTDFIVRDPKPILQAIGPYPKAGPRKKIRTVRTVIHVFTLVQLRRI